MLTLLATMFSGKRSFEMHLIELSEKRSKCIWVSARMKLLPTVSVSNHFAGIRNLTQKDKVTSNRNWVTSNHESYFQPCTKKKFASPWSVNYLLRIILNIGFINIKRKDLYSVNRPGRLLERGAYFQQFKIRWALIRGGAYKRVGV